MPKRIVTLKSEDLYHVYNRGHNFSAVFYEPENYLFFLKRLRNYVADQNADILAYVLMPNHYHLLVQLISDDFSHAMQRFTISFTKAMNKRYGHVGAFFQGSFQAKHIAEDSYLLHLSRYIYLNPVLAGLVDCPERWEFSSYPEYIGIRYGTLPRSEIVLGQFSSVRAYREFVESYTPDDRKAIAGLLFD